MDDNELYPIGDVARRTGLSVSAIRFYSDAGVIPPTGYRLYDVHAIAGLELVRTLRELGAGLDDIRRLLADETTLHDLATEHLALVEARMRRLHAQRAVLRTIVKQHSATEQVSLMHKLVSMSDDDREHLIDRFWDEVCDGLNVHPAFADLLHQSRPKLPEEPTTEQLEAWIELADLVQDAGFRHSVRAFFHDAFGGARSFHTTTPPMLERIEKLRTAQLEAIAAQRSGLPADSPRAREIAEHLLDAMTEVVGQRYTTELRHRMATAEHTASPRAARFTSRFTGTLGRYHALVATINGTPRLDPADFAANRRWLATAVTTDPRPAATGPAAADATAEPPDAGDDR